MHYLLLPLRRYADFSGRSRRLEFWLWALLNTVVAGILTVMILMSVFDALAGLRDRAAAGEFDGLAGSELGYVDLNGDVFYVPPEILFRTVFEAMGVPGILFLIYSVLLFIPNLAVSVRRLHDQDKSGWWILIGFIPIVGGIWLLVLYLLDGTRGPNRFGPDPKEPPTSQIFT
ncbi:MAG TPA: DUF805 domain-containing protein [Allosphingosinicella sp.]|nr:DUF805 domain-containing protein [Allosphingosinicella sp.]